jgi:hypothetical protein
MFTGSLMYSMAVTISPAYALGLDIQIQIHLGRKIFSFADPNSARTTSEFDASTELSIIISILSLLCTVI